MTNPRVVVNGKIDVEATKELLNREPFSKRALTYFLISHKSKSNDALESFALEKALKHP